VPGSATQHWLNPDHSTVFIGLIMFETSVSKQKISIIGSFFRSEKSAVAKHFAFESDS
jgi:hypothetical protein